MLFILLVAAINYSWTGAKEISKGHFHRSADLPNLYNDWFAASGTCVQCHGSDPAEVANVDAFGNDVNVVDDWKGGIMANSARDPFWKAKVSHEILSNPSHQEILENKCTQCHAPMGNYNKVLNGGGHYSLAELALDSVAMDGVSCLACHMQSDEELGQQFSGNLNYDTLFKAFGPFISPLVSPMANATGYIPEYSEHISDAGVCAGCHSLITETVDLDGNFTGDEFVEQATYHEWLNSSYNTGASLEQTCQDCHMPEIESPVLLANGFNTEPRTPYSLHELVGANSFMLEMMAENINTLGLVADMEDFQSVAEKSLVMLQSAVTIDLELIDRSSDTAYFEVELRNLAGHKFPSGFPSRRAYIEFVVIDDANDTLFKSGILDNNGYLINYDSDYELHYDVISSEEEVQVYEMIMADVNDEPTTVLERAKYALKDNRLPPIGFTDTHFAYDTCAVFGEALNDPNFNFDLAQGSGSDRINYWIPMEGYTGDLTVLAALKYQSIPRKWLDDMFSYSSEEIELFQYLFDEADQEAIEVASEELITDPLSIEQLHFSSLSIYPSITNTGEFFVKNPYGLEGLEVDIYTTTGELVLSKKLSNNSLQEVKINSKNGLYLVCLRTNQLRQVHRVVLVN